MTPLASTTRDGARCGHGGEGRLHEGEVLGGERGQVVAQAGRGEQHTRLDRLLPVCAQLLDAAVASGEIRSGLVPDLDAYQLMRGIGNLCIGADGDPRYDARRLVALLVAGLRQPR